MSASYGSGKVGDNRGIFEEIVRLQGMGQRAALASPVQIAGSVPCGNESRLLLREDGSFLGTVGGGLLEAEVLQRAVEVIASDRPSLMEFELTQDDAAEAGMICGGTCTVLIEPIGPDHPTEVYSATAAAEANGADTVLITVLPEDGSFHKLAWLSGRELVGSTGDLSTDTMLRQMAERLGAEVDPSLCAEPICVCMQPIHSPPPLFIFGAGHVAVPVAHLADLVGFRTTVIDDRGDFASTNRFPNVDQVMAATVDEAFHQLPIGAGAYIVAITRGHALDEEVVAHALRTPARYIGMIGSKRKVAAVYQRLRDRGFSDADLARLHAPIGIEIGAETVEEIAVSIAAELVAVRRAQTNG